MKNPDLDALSYMCKWTSKLFKDLDFIKKGKEIYYKGKLICANTGSWAIETWLNKSGRIYYNLFQGRSLERKHFYSVLLCILHKVMLNAYDNFSLMDIICIFKFN